MRPTLGRKEGGDSCAVVFNVARFDSLVKPYSNTALQFLCIDLYALLQRALKTVAGLYSLCPFLHQFVIAELFISTSCNLLSCMFGVHHLPVWKSGTLGGIIASMTRTLYALRWQWSTVYLGVILLKRISPILPDFRYALPHKGACMSTQHIQHLCLYIQTFQTILSVLYRYKSLAHRLYLPCMFQ